MWMSLRVQQSKGLSQVIIVYVIPYLQYFDYCKAFLRDVMWFIGEY